MMTTRLVVLISGNGSNLQVILDACENKILQALVVAVISNKPDVFGLSRAEGAGVSAIVLPKREGESRLAYDARLATEVTKWQADYIILAGWMRLLTATFLDQFPGRVINLHPALPGTFPGTHAIERAYAAWQRNEIDRTGVMIHLVPDEGVDDGPVIATREIFFQSDEGFEKFEARVHMMEHELILDALKKFLDNRLSP